MISRQLSALVLSALFAAPVVAVTVDGLYGATVPVADRSVQASDRGVTAAFTDVLFKLTGSRAVLAGKQARALTATARNFVTVVGQAQGGNATDGYRLRVEFDAAALSAALRERDLVLWSRDRPLTRAWLAVDDAGIRHFNADESSRPFFSAVTAAAERRGLPFTQAEAAQGPASGAASALLDALLGPDAPPGAAGTPAVAPPPPRLAALLTKASETAWTVDWRLRVGGQSSDWHDSGADLLALVDGGITHVTEQVASAYTTAGSNAETSEVPLSVAGLQGAADYGRTLAMLRGFDIVEHVDVKSVTGDQVQFAISARGGQQALVQSLRLTGQLKVVDDDPARWVLAPR